MLEYHYGFGHQFYLSPVLRCVRKQWGLGGWEKCGVGGLLTQIDGGMGWLLGVGCLGWRSRSNLEIAH